MLKACAQTVQNWCISAGKTCVRLSTNIVPTPAKAIAMWVQAQVMPNFNTVSRTGFSPIKNTLSPLFYNEFYPLSTAPTIITTKEIL